jgi:hypothetical protein
VKKKRKENQAQIKNKRLETVEIRRIKLRLGRKTVAYQEMPKTSCNPRDNKK